MRLIIVAISIALLLLIVAVVLICRCYKIFSATQFLGLSTASQTDCIGGVGISILSPLPEGIATVVNLLGVSYPASEVVVAINRVQQRNLLLQLKIRYSLIGFKSQEGEVYRSYRYCFRRLIVVASDSVLAREQLIDLAARNAIYDYLLAVPCSCHLFADSLGLIADSVASQTEGRVDMATTTDSDIVLLSRNAWRKNGGFCAALQSLQYGQKLHISQILTLNEKTQSEHSLIIERARYNFWDFLALNIMKFRNKLLSLKKP